MTFSFCEQNGLQHIFQLIAEGNKIHSSLVTFSQQIEQANKNTFSILKQTVELKNPGLGGTRTLNQCLKRALLYH